MKKIIAIFIVLVVIAAGAFAGAFVSMWDLKSAWESRDAGKISELIDYPVLRGNLKQQINDRMAKSLGKDSATNKVGYITAGLASSMTDSLIDMYVAPETIGKLIFAEGEISKLFGVQKTADDTDNTNNSGYSFEGFNRLAVNTGKGNLRIILTRDFFRWKITDVVFAD